jgi:surface antigen
MTSNPFGKGRTAIAALCACATLGGCSGGFDLRDPGTWTRQDAGVALGSLTGGLLGGSFGSSTGTRVAGAAVGAVAGGLLGGAIGGDLDARARGMAIEAQNRALDAPPGGRPIGWTTDDGIASGDVVPGTLFVSRGRSCRDYVQRIHVQGQNRTARGVACRNADGSWSPV